MKPPLFQPRFKPQSPTPACRNHPTQQAVRDGLCKNCLFFRDRGKNRPASTPAAAPKPALAKAVEPPRAPAPEPRPVAAPPPPPPDVPQRAEAPEKTKKAKTKR